MVCSEKSLNFMIIILVYFEDYYEQNSYKQSARYAILFIQLGYILMM